LNDLICDTNIFFKKGIGENIIAQIGNIDSNGNSTEESKMIFETQKILNKNFDVFATAVRVPIQYCHGESVFVEFESDIELNDIKQALLCDYLVLSQEIVYPVDCAGSNLTFVYRLRKVAKNKIEFFILADNLRRGAAYNAVCILEKLAKI